MKKKLFSYLLQGIGNFKILDLNLPLSVNSIAFTLNSPFKSIFAEIDTRIKESGIALKWASDLKTTKLEERSVEFESDSEAMRVILPYVIGIGCSLGFIVLLLKIVWHRVTIYNDIYYNNAFDNVHANYYSRRNLLELVKFVLNLDGLRKLVDRLWKGSIHVVKWCWFKIKPSRFF